MTFDPSKLSGDALSEWLLDYVRGRLTAEQVAGVEAAVASDPRLAEEVAYYRGLSNTVSTMPSSAVPDELGWARLQKAIAEDASHEAAVPPAANDNQPFWKYAAAALAMVAALQTAFLVQSNTGPEEPAYVTASAENAEDYALDIMFRPEATADAITEALRGVEAEIFEGPSALDLYAVRFENEESRDQALNTLKQNSDLIETVTIR